MRDDKRSSVVPLVLLIGALVLPVLYVLSIAPAIWLVSNGYLSDATYNAVYWPLIKAAGATGTRPLLIRYINWWLGEG